MLRRLRPHLTYANVIATLALFLALTGGVYAASKINGSKIKRESIPGKKLKNDGVTGQQVDESTLGKVPSAENADNAQTAQTATSAQTAQTAASAQTLAGTEPGGFVSAANVKTFRFDVRVPEGPPGQPAFAKQTVLGLGPLELTATCDRRNDIFHIDATSSAPSAGIDSGWTETSNNDTDGLAKNAGGGVGSTPLRVTWAGGGAGFRRKVGTIVYNDPSTVIAIPFAIFYEVGADAVGTRCFFTGTATMTRG